MSINEQIAAAEQELNVRERAAKHLRGIPARQNASAIETLCDTLTALHIMQLERGAVTYTEQGALAVFADASASDAWRAAAIEELL